MKSQGEIYFQEFLVRFSTLSDADVVELLNSEVGNKGWGTARASYLAAIHHEFQRRKIDYSEIGDSKSLSLANKVVLRDNKLIIAGEI